MNDRELLEMAARAAGMQVNFGACSHGGPPYDAGSGRYWNPLTDDGDALRLATELELDITFNAFGANEVMVSDSKDRFDGWFTEPYGTDKAAATRRAIVRAAAAMAGE